MVTRRTYMLDGQDTYVVLSDSGYYAGDCQHPQGWCLSVADDPSSHPYNDLCVGTLAQCEAWLNEIYSAGPFCLDHNQASQSYRTAKLLDDDADYQGWIELRNWDGCPSVDGSDGDANCAWAEDQAYWSNGVLPIAAPDGRSFLVDLAAVEEAANA